ncbi:MAG: hypothetical protein ACOCXQ_04220 [Patescibacteria group bacterium]
MLSVILMNDPQIAQRYLVEVKESNSIQRFATLLQGGNPNAVGVVWWAFGDRPIVPVCDGSLNLDYLVAQLLTQILYPEQYSEYLNVSRKFRKDVKVRLYPVSICLLLMSPSRMEPFLDNPRMTDGLIESMYDLLTSYLTNVDVSLLVQQVNSRYRDISGSDAYDIIVQGEEHKVVALEITNWIRENLYKRPYNVLVQQLYAMLLSKYSEKDFSLISTQVGVLTGRTR